MNTKAQISKLITKLKNSEKVTKEVLATLSRELLDYVINTSDIASVNRVLEILTPVNKLTAIAYFRHFLPFRFDEKASVFGSLNKKFLTKKFALIDDFLTDNSNDIWSWANDNIEIKPKEFNARKYFANAVNRCIKEGLAPADMLELLSTLSDSE